MEIFPSTRFEVAVSGTRLLLSEEFGSYLFESEAHVEIATAICEGRTQEELRAWLIARKAPEESAGVLQDLAGVGFLRSTAVTRDLPVEAWWESVETGSLPQEISFVSLCRVGEGLLRHLFLGTGLTIAEDRDLLIVSVDDYLGPQLAAINRRDRPWLLAKPVGHRILLGPYFVPGETACWECLAWWIRANRWQNRAFHGAERSQVASQPSLAHTPATLAAACGAIATAAAVIAGTGSHTALLDTVLAFDSRDLSQTRHPVRRIPGCAVCGNSKMTQRPAPALDSFVSDVTGVASEFELWKDSGYFHARANHIHPLPPAWAGQVLREAGVYGKGATAAKARQSCLGEAIERYSYAYAGNEPVRRARMSEIPVIPPPDILLFSEAQYENRDSWNSERPAIHNVPLRFREESDTGWVTAVSLHTGEERYAPAQAVYFNYSCGEAKFCTPDSNGCAAGRTREHATLNALLELVERDAIAIWWYNRLQRPELDCAALGDASVNRIARQFRRGGRAVYLLDLTTDLEIPVIAALAPAPHGKEVYLAAAAHVTFAKAAEKALAELSQIAFWEKRVPPTEELANWLRTADVSDPEYRYLIPAGMREVQTYKATSHSDSLAFCLERLKAAKIEAFAVDLTRPEIRISVIRAIAPGLRHFWPRYAPGRLYEVPVKLGWLASATPEALLNPTGCWL